MIKKSEVLVIGGGCVGTSIAYHLAKMGCSEVALLEKSHLAWGATGKSSAIVNMGVWNASRQLVRMLVESINVFHNFQETVGGDCGFVQTGWMGVAGTAQAKRVERTAIVEREMGADTKILSVSELKELEPRIYTDDVALAIYEGTSGYADPVKTTTSFAQQAEKLGAQVVTGVKATKIVTENGQVRGVETDHGPIEAKRVVNAANVWANGLFATCGVQLPITPTRKQVCLFKRPADFGKPHMITDDFVSDLYMKPEGEQTLAGEIESPGEPMDPDNYNEGVDFDRISRYAERLMHRFPVLGAAGSKGGYSGPYDVSPDGHPILDEIQQVRGLFCAVGLSGHGFRFSPSTGRLMAEFILNGKTTGIHIREYRLSRFAEGKPITPIS